MSLSLDIDALVFETRKGPMEQAMLANVSLAYFCLSLQHNPNARINVGNVCSNCNFLYVALCFLRLISPCCTVCLTLTTLCLGMCRSQTCQSRSSQSSIQYRDLGKEAGQRKTCQKDKEQNQVFITKYIYIGNWNLQNGSQMYKCVLVLKCTLTEINVMRWCYSNNN